MSASSTLSAKKSTNRVSASFGSSASALGFNGSFSALNTNPSGKRPSATFQMFKAMEAKEEFQKMRLAGFLRDLHELAEEDNKQQAQERISATITTTATPPVDVDRPTSTNGSVSLHTVPDLRNMSLQVAQEKIDALHAGEQLDSDSFILLCETATSVMEQESTVVDLRGLLLVPEGEETTIEHACSVVGDLHGSLNCLHKVLDLVQIDRLEQEGRVVVFDGDYVDRGEHSLEVLSTLLLLKLVYPTRVILLRGNHEDIMTASIYGFRDELEEKYADAVAADDTFSHCLWETVGKVFAALPIAARTETAVVLHGGIPTADFSLDLLNAIDPYTRSQLTTVVQPDDPDEELIQGVMWSDPSPDFFGIEASPRGAGFEFGPDIADDFLRRHDLRYVIRAHEPVEEGTELVDAYSEEQGYEGRGSEERGVVTVFSAAAYPNGEGTNLGAILNLWVNGRGYDTVGFSYEDAEDSVNDHVASYSSLPENPTEDGQQRQVSTHQERQQYEEILKTFVNDHRSKLARGFRAVEKKPDDADGVAVSLSGGVVTVEQWVTVVAESLELYNVPWDELQPHVAPTTVKNGNHVDWRSFLTKYSNKGILPHQFEQMDQDQIAVLNQHRDKFLNIFSLLDIDGSGTISMEEFAKGIEALKDQILAAAASASESKDGETLISLTQCPEELFRVLDLDGDGEISIAEFTQALSHSATLQNVTKALDPHQIDMLQENHEMLLVAFKYLDADKSGAIDRKEFQRGIDLLNRRLPEKGQLDDPDELFSLLDADGNGEIGTSLTCQCVFTLVCSVSLAWLEICIYSCVVASASCFPIREWQPFSWHLF
jgi:diadenosine tetraphosphatase ApaH/serine/threonine PP2A family protein phosphatase/Ca2+-binding EF-hand superfamily protein